MRRISYLVQITVGQFVGKITDVYGALTGSQSATHGAEKQLSSLVDPCTLTFVLGEVLARSPCLRL